MQDIASPVLHNLISNNSCAAVCAVLLPVHVCKHMERRRSVGVLPCGRPPVMLLLRKSRCVMFVNSLPHEGDKDPDMLLPDMSKLSSRYSPSQAGPICPACARHLLSYLMCKRFLCFQRRGADSVASNLAGCTGSQTMLLAAVIHTFWILEVISKACCDSWGQPQHSGCS